MNEFLTVTETARRLSISRPTTIRLIQTNQLRAERKTLKRRSEWLVESDSVEEYRAARRAERRQP
ncbi:hypothetical protein COT29_03125 [Candidatus Micrarchaeota archaeon CG08_land_8_20_14_0_20_59_11]|nr:MAG: hypothetical protein COT29_03125 [Candidatus Micrarchaeota archaeon CG08_land_8_20_14_0_20_59_11]